jgi:translation initiation factor 1 (eIF-1/SUI1)
MTDFNNSNQIENNLYSDIHIYVQQRGTKKADTLIKGLFFHEQQESKNFLSHIKKKFGINGCIKKIEELDPVNDIFQFSGDYSEKIRDVLIKNYSKNEENIRLHGNKL